MGWNLTVSNFRTEQKIQKALLTAKGHLAKYDLRKTLWTSTSPQEGKYFKFDKWEGSKPMWLLTVTSFHFL